MPKPKLTPAMVDIICDAHSKGLPIKYCADLVGVSRVSIYNWKNKGKAGSHANKGLYIELYNGLCKARAKCIQYYLMKARELNSPGLVEYMLKVLSPEDFNIASRVESKQEHTIRDLVDEDLIRELANED